MINPLYANFAIDDNGYAKVVYSITREKPNGEKSIIGKDIVAIDGKSMPKQIIKAAYCLEYAIDNTDPLGTYTFIIESKDLIGNKTTENVFQVNFTDYKYENIEFKTVNELLEFIYN